MEENREVYEGDVKIKTPFLKKLDNFWYHYKWHTIVSVFVVLTLSLLIMQTCSKVSYDAQILYAGPYEIKRTSADGDISPHAHAISSLKKVCEDFDNDGNVNITLLNLFVVNSEEAERLLEENTGMEINSALVKEDSDTLSQTLLYGDHYVCFLSERLFLEYEEKYEGALFAPLEKYLDSDKDYEMASERGVYLCSLPFSALPEIGNLPDDTVVCIRQLSEVSSVFAKEESAENFRRGEEIITNILNYE